MRIFYFRDILPEIFNILIRRRFRFNFELLPFEAKGLRLKKIANFFIAGMNQFILPSKPLGFPVIAQVEPANYCNLSCPLCLTTTKTAARPKALLSFDTFKSFIDETGDYLLLIVLWNWGEPFLNPDIFRMIEYAKKKNIIIHSSTNGNLKFDEDEAEKLVDSGLDSLVVAVDGATQETYAKYRAGGNLEQVLSNIKAVVAVREKKGSRTPRLNMRCVVTRQNEKEIPRIRQLAKEIGVDFLLFKSVAMSLPEGDCLDVHYVPEDQDYRMYEYETGSYARKQKPFKCMRPWKRITLDALGEIISCEYEYKNIHSFGNLNHGKSAMSVWKGVGAGDFRKEFNMGQNDFYLCKNCVYKNMTRDDCNVERIDVGSRKDQRGGLKDTINAKGN